MNSTAQDVFDSFETSFQDKQIIPFELETEWLCRAVGAYSTEIEPISFDNGTLSFDRELDKYVIDTLATMMRVYYQEREVSKVNKRVSIVSKELSIDGTNGSKTSAQNELNYFIDRLAKMLANQKPTAYS